MTKDNQNNPDLVENIKKAMENKNLVANISKVAELLTQSDKAPNIQKLLSSKVFEKVQEKNRLEKSMAHMDPRLNLLLAMRPFLSKYKAQKIEIVTKAIALGSVFEEINKII